MGVTSDTGRGAAINRQAWNSIRRQRDAGLIRKHLDVAAEYLAGETSLYSERRDLLGDIEGKRVLDLLIAAQVPKAGTGGSWDLGFSKSCSDQ